MKSPMPLRRYLSLQFAAVAVLPVVIIAVLVWLTLVPQVRTRIGVQHESLAHTVAGQIWAHLKGGERQLIALAYFVTTNKHSPAGQLPHLLDAQCGNGDLFETIYIVTKPDAVIQSVGLAHGRRLKREDLLGMDISGLFSMIGAGDKDQPTWSQTFLSIVSSRLAVALTVPLTDGMIVGEITLDRFSEFISHLPVESGLLTLVLDQHGRIVADSQRVRWGQQLDLRILPPSVGEGETPLASDPFQLDGQSLLGTVVNVPKIGWKVLVAQPMQTALKPLHNGFIMIVLGLGAALILALAVAWLQAGDLSTLFLLYAKQVQHIARGEYELEWTPPKTAEFQDLAENLQCMAEKVQQRENQLLENEARLLITQFSVNAAAIGIYRIGSDARILEVNDKAARILGYTKEELSTMSISDIDPSVTSEKWGAIWQRLQDQETDMFATIHRGKNGRDIPMEIHSNLLEYDGRQYSIAFVQDITDRKRSDEELRHLRNYLSNIINSMPSVLVGVDRDGKVTQWNRQAVQMTGLSVAKAQSRPLAGILQNASVLENRLIGNLPANRKAAEAAGISMAAIQQYLELRKLTTMLENIRTSGSMAAAIVKNMLSFARKSENIVSSHDLGSLLDRTLDLLKSDYNMKKHYDFKLIEIVREYDNTAGPIPCEPSKLQQVFMNILKNGAEAMAAVKIAAAPPAFILRVKNDNACMRVEIEDNGPGMDEDIRRRIFEPFFTTKPVGKGTGLGLSVSYFIVTEDHGGEMGVQATQGGGTRFVIRLPKTGKKKVLDRGRNKVNQNCAGFTFAGFIKI